MTQGELEKLALKTGNLFSELEIRIMLNIARRIKDAGFSTASADWQIKRLEELGKAESEIKSWVQEALQKTDEEMEHIFSDEVYKQYYQHARVYKASGVEMLPFKDNTPLIRLTEAVKSQISGEYKNLAGSMGFAIRGPDGRIQASPLMTFYRSTLDNAVLDIQSGGFDYGTVLKRTVSRMTNSGLRWIDYDSGVHSRVDVAARRAVMTGFRQVQGKINEQVAADLGTNTYEVSYHVGARPSHQPWQGRVWTMEQLQSVCGLGTVTGLHGANCYHDYSPFIPGVSARTYTDDQLQEMLDEENTPKDYYGKSYTTYEALQEQRKMERNMRATRQQVKLLQAGGADEKDVILKKAKYQGQLQKYADFSKAMHLPEQKQRIAQDGLRGRFTPTKAETSKLVENIEKAEKPVIMKSDLGKFKEKLRTDKNIGREYYDCLKGKFEHGSADAKKLFVKCASGNTVADCAYEGIAHYNTVTQKIYMHYEADMNNSRGNGVTWFHEHGHLIDDVLGAVSNDRHFKELLVQDAFQYRMEYGKRHNLRTFDKVDDAIGKELRDVRKYSAVSDLMGAVTQGNIRGCSGHESNYWNNPRNVTAEAFAHMFEAQFDKARYAEMKKYFPQALEYFEKELKEVSK